MNKLNEKLKEQFEDPNSQRILKEVKIKRILKNYASNLYDISIRKQGTNLFDSCMMNFYPLEPSRFTDQQELTNDDLKILSCNTNIIYFFESFINALLFKSIFTGVLMHDEGNGCFVVISETDVANFKGKF